MSKNNELEKHFTASALIVHNCRVLLLYHKKLDIWLYPGGHVEKNETPEQTVLREVMEETGLKVEIIGQKDKSLADIETDVSVLHNPYAILCELVGNHYHNDIIYLCEISGDLNELKCDKAESNDIKFFGINDLKNIRLFPNFRRLLEKVLKNQE
jgi:8-oxo-dGTP pyrophosphatase MutT (NUDIX family)